MNKAFVTLIALSALSGTAFALGDDHGGNAKDNLAFISQSSTKALVVAPVTSGTSVQKENYLNWNQLR